jgi:hypothetical protein
MKPRILLLVFLALLLSACGPSPEQQATMTATALTATAAAWTATPSPTPTLTSTPTLTPTPTITPTRTPTATPTPDPNRYYAPDNTFSFVMLDGWQPMEVGLKYPALAGPSVGGFSINLVFVEDESGFDPFMYSAIVQDQAAADYPDLQTISEDFLATVDNVDYFRWEATNIQQGSKFTQIFYFFGSGNWNLTVTFTRPYNQGMEYDEIVDDAMSTMRFKH